MEFSVETTIHASPERIFRAWLDSDEHSAMTGGIATTTQEVGDKFTAWDGYIWGTTLETKANRYIKQSWRTTDFQEEQASSIVEVFLDPASKGATKIRIRHSELSEADGHYEQGWIDHYFAPMKSYFEH